MATLVGSTTLSMSNSEPFLQPSGGSKRCLLYDEDVTRRSKLKYRKTVKFKKDLSAIKEHAIKWKDLDIPESDVFSCFMGASDKLCDKN